MNEGEKYQADENLPESSLLNLLAESDLVDLGTDLGEGLLDQLLSDGLVRDIPLLGIIASLAKFGKDLNGYLFTKKLLKFLTHIKDIPQTQREKFVREIQSDEKFRKRVGENLLLLLNRLDDIQKAELLSLAFKAYIEGRIDYSTYQGLSRAIDRVRLDHLNALIGFYREGDAHKVANDEIMQDLQMAGLVNFRPLTGMIVGPVESYLANDLGKLFINIILTSNVDW